MALLSLCAAVLIGTTCGLNSAESHVVIDSHGKGHKHLTSKQQQEPNILYILMDDLGYGDISARGAEFETPNIDSLYSDSIVLNKHYIGLVCSPTRTQILSGRYAWNFGHSIQRAYNVASFAAMPAALPTIGNLLREYTNYNSYATGKWHLGYSTNGHLPLNRGFEQFHGFYGSGVNYETKEYIDTNWNGPYIDWRDNWDVDYETQYTFSTYVTGDKIEKMIEYNEFLNNQNNEDKSWYIYAAFQAPHEPMVDVDDYSDACNKYSLVDDYRNTMCQNMLALDDVIGDITSYLKENNYWDNTLIVFTSDNGGEGGSTGRHSTSGSCNYPLRGTKGTFFEGGIRTIAFVAGGYVEESQKGSERNEYMHAVDWVPTLLTIAGADLSEIKNDLYNNVYLSIAAAVSKDVYGSDDYEDHVSDYTMSEVFDGYDLSQWLLYGDSNDNERDMVPLSINEYNSRDFSELCDNNGGSSSQDNSGDNENEDDIPDGDISFIFKSSITGNTYKFMYLTDAPSDVTRRTYCTDEDTGLATLCEDKDPINFSMNLLLFDLDNDEYETTNLFENMDQDNSELLQSIFEEAMDLTDKYMKNPMFNNALSCHYTLYETEAEPSNFGSKALIPFLTWTEYEDEFTSECGNEINSVLKQFYLTKYEDYVKAAQSSKTVLIEKNENVIVNNNKYSAQNVHNTMVFAVAGVILVSMAIAAFCLKWKNSIGIKNNKQFELSNEYTPLCKA